MAPLLSRATHPERVRRTSESASRQLRCRSILSAPISSATVAPPLRRFASARSHLRRRRSHPGILQERSSWGHAATTARVRRRHTGCRSRVIAPHSSRQPACRPPRATISSCASVRRAKDSHDGLFSALKLAYPHDHYSSLTLRPTGQATRFLLQMLTKAARPRRRVDRSSPRLANTLHLSPSRRLSQLDSGVTSGLSKCSRRVRQQAHPRCRE